MTLLITVDDANGTVARTVFHTTEDTRGYLVLLEGLVRQRAVAALPSLFPGLCGPCCSGASGRMLIMGGSGPGAGWSGGNQARHPFKNEIVRMVLEDLPHPNTRSGEFWKPPAQRYHFSRELVKTVGRLSETAHLRKSRMNASSGELKKPFPDVVDVGFGDTAR